MGASLRLRSPGIGQSDTEDLFELYRQELRRYIEPAFGWNEDLQRVRFGIEYPDACWSLIDYGDEVAGALALTTRPTGPHVSLLLIHRQYQGRGLGSKVLQQLLENANGVGKRLSLSTFASNHRALALYLRLGLTIVRKEGPFVDLMSPAASER